MEDYAILKKSACLNIVQNRGCKGKKLKGGDIPSEGKESAVYRLKGD